MAVARSSELSGGTTGEWFTGSVLERKSDFAGCAIGCGGADITIGNAAFADLVVTEFAGGAVVHTN